MQDIPIQEIPVVGVEAAPPTIAPPSNAMGRTARRIVGGFTALGSGAVLSLAAWITPSGAGLGSHQQLNMPPCGWVATMGIPCPSCGMTTAFAHAADGNILKSFLTQPLGCILAVSLAMVLLIGLYTAITGSRIAIVLASLWTRRTTWGLIGIALAAWVYKIISYRGLI